MSTDRAEQILDIAEREMRKGGFDAVSFRDIASAIGIKSASVHYHFPTKADLSKSVTRRYADRFIEALESPSDPSETAKDRLQRLAAAYLGAYKSESSTCLCTVLASVVSHLPEETSAQIRAFYRRLGDWIDMALSDHETSLTPSLIIGALQGAMILAIATEDETPLNEAEAFLLKTL